MNRIQVLNRLINECKFCNSKCKNLCFGTWKVYQETKFDKYRDDYQESYQEKYSGKFLFSKRDFYINVALIAIDHPEFITYGYGGRIVLRNDNINYNINLDKNAYYLNSNFSKIFCSYDKTLKQ